MSREIDLISSILWFFCLPSAIFLWVFPCAMNSHGSHSLIAYIYITPMTHFRMACLCYLLSNFRCYICPSVPSLGIDSLGSFTNFIASPQQVSDTMFFLHTCGHECTFWMRKGGSIHSLDAMCHYVVGEEYIVIPKYPSNNHYIKCLIITFLY